MALLSKLADLQTKGSKNLIRTFGSLVLAFFALQGANEEGLIHIEALNYSASFDGIFIALMASGILFLNALEIQKFIVLMGLRNEVANRIRVPGFSAQAALFIDGHEELMPAIPVLPFSFLISHFSFLKDRFPVSGALSMLTMIVFIGLMAPLPFLAYSFFAFGWSEIDLSNGFLFGAILPAVLLIFVISSPVFLLVSNLPIPMLKNSSAIRWGFLFDYRRDVNHPQLQKWIDSD